MFTTELLLKSSAAVPTLSDPRGGSGAVFAVDIRILEGSFPVLAVDVEHKNKEDTSYVVVASFEAITLPGVAQKYVSDLKEEVRLSFTLSAGKWARIAVLAPQWVD
jgi:hypothetical protein